MRPKLHRSFLELSDFLESYYQTLKTKQERGVLIFPIGESKAVGRRIFENLSSGGTATFIVTGRNLWNPIDPYYEAQRTAARRGCKITRIFVLPHRVLVTEPLLVEHCKLDRQAGINVIFVHAGKLLFRGIVPPAHTLDLGVWDSSFVCFVSYQNYEGNTVPYEWRVSRRPEDLEFGQLLINAIVKNKDLAIDETAEESELDLDEPMLKSAPLMSMLSEVMCRGSYMSGEDCSWYHRIWQYLRIFNLVSTPTWHHEFYIESLKSLFINKNRRINILICGTADYSMLAHVLHAFSNSQAEPEITVLDLCQTPLVICEWYAIKNGKKIRTVQHDILKFDERSYFDLVITDAFLTRFSDDEKLEILRKWRWLLKEGGIVATTIRLEKVNGLVRATENEMSEFIEKVRKSAKAWQPFLRESTDDIVGKAQEYAENMTSFPIVDREHFQSMISENGFSIMKDDVVKVKGEMHETPYLELIAKAGEKGD